MAKGEEHPFNRHADVPKEGVGKSFVFDGSDETPCRACNGSGVAPKSTWDFQGGNLAPVVCGPRYGGHFPEKEPRG